MAGVERSSALRSLRWACAAAQLWIFGELLFDNATPARLHGHAPWFTALFVLVRPRPGSPCAISCVSGMRAACTASA